MEVAEYNPEPMKGITISIDLKSEKLQWYVCKSLVCEHESNFLKFLRLNVHIILSSVITARNEMKLVRMNLKKIGTYVKSLVCEHESKCIIAAKDCSSSSLSSTQPTFNSTPTAPLNSATKS